MPEGLVKTAAQTEEPEDRRFYGVALAQVINNVDITGLSRVQIRLPWLPDYKPWARLAVMDRGAYFIPRIRDEVLVAFNHGDVREPYIIGCLWNMQDRPPSTLPTDSINKRIIRTPLGHEIEFDDLTQSLTISTSTKQKIEITPKNIEISTTGNTASITLDTAGNISIKSKVQISLESQKISIKGSIIETKSDVNTNIDGGSLCKIKGGSVQIN